MNAVVKEESVFTRYPKQLLPMRAKQVNKSKNGIMKYTSGSIHPLNVDVIIETLGTTEAKDRSRIISPMRARV